MGVAPIALFTYNRSEHLQLTLEALKRCDLANESDLYVFSDAPKTAEGEAAVTKVRDVLARIDGFASVKVVARQHNFGLASSIISGVTELCRIHGQVIVLEDDLVVSPAFLRFMNEALRQYRDEKSVMQVSGYVLPMSRITQLGDTFMCRVPTSWGWATWDRAWKYFNQDSDWLLAQLSSETLRQRFDVDGTYPYLEMLQQHAEGRLDVWGVRWYASMFLEEGLCIYPTESLVRNIGMDGSGMHCDASTRFDVRLSTKDCWRFTQAIEESQVAVEMFSQFFRTMRAQNNAAATTSFSPWFRRVTGKWHSMVGRVRSSSSGRRKVL